MNKQDHSAINSDPLVDECKVHIERAKLVIGQMESLKNGRDMFIYDYFEEIKRQVDLRRETLKHEIDEYSDKILEQVEKAKSDSMKIQVQIENISKVIDLANIELDKLRDQFNALDLNETNLNNFKRDIVRSCKKFGNKLMNCKILESILQKKKFSFNFPNRIKIENVFGRFIERDLKSGKFIKKYKD